MTTGTYLPMSGTLTETGPTTWTPARVDRASHTKDRPPTIKSFNANASSKANPKKFSFSVEATDADGTIAQYDWDFDGNGVYDATTSSDPVSYESSLAGTYD